MPDLHELHGKAACKLGRAIDAATPDNAPLPDLADAYDAVAAIGEYALALALDRIAQAGPNAPADPLTKAILTRHRLNLPDPQRPR